MKTPFKLRSGNASSFKNLGSSPAKQLIDLEAIKEKLPKQEIGKSKGRMQGPPEGSGQALPHQTTKKEFFDAMSEATKKSPVKGKGDNLKRIMSENKAAQKKAGTFYAPGANPNKSSMPKDFNVKGSRTSTTPKYNPNMPKGFNVKGSSSSTTPKYSTPKSSSYTASSSSVSSGATQYPRRAKSIANRIGLPKKIISKIAAPLTIAATLYDMYKSGQKHSGGKAVKGQKSFMEDAKKKTKSIFKKKDRY